MTDADEPVERGLCEPEDKCVRCNNFRDPSDLASINGAALCHGAMDRTPTCYERTVREGDAEHPAHVAAAISGRPSTPTTPEETPR